MSIIQDLLFRVKTNTQSAEASLLKLASKYNKALNDPSAQAGGVLPSNIQKELERVSKTTGVDISVLTTSALELAKIKQQTLDLDKKAVLVNKELEAVVQKHTEAERALTNQSKQKEQELRKVLGLRSNASQASVEASIKELTLAQESESVNEQQVETFEKVKKIQVELSDLQQQNLNTLKEHRKIEKDIEASTAKVNKQIDKRRAALEELEDNHLDILQNQQEQAALEKEQNRLVAEGTQLRIDREARLTAAQEAQAAAQAANAKEMATATAETGFSDAYVERLNIITEMRDVIAENINRSEKENELLVQKQKNEEAIQATIEEGSKFKEKNVTLSKSLVNIEKRLNKEYEKAGFAVENIASEQEKQAAQTQEVVEATKASIDLNEANAEAIERAGNAADALQQRLELAKQRAKDIDDIFNATNTELDSSAMTAIDLARALNQSVNPTTAPAGPLSPESQTILDAEIEARAAQLNITVEELKQKLTNIYAISQQISELNQSDIQRQQELLDLEVKKLDQIEKRDASLKSAAILAGLSESASAEQIRAQIDAEEEQGKITKKRKQEIEQIEKLLNKTRGHQSFITRVTKEQTTTAQAIQQSNEKSTVLIGEYSELARDIVKTKEEEADISAQLVPIQVKTTVALRSATKEAENMAEALEKSEKESAELNKTTKKHKDTFAGRAISAVLYYEALNILKRSARAAIATITELDAALTDIAVVTTMSREET